MALWWNNLGSLTIKQDLEVFLNETAQFVSSLAVYKKCVCVFQPIVLVLLDIPPMLPVLDGVVMELQDCALPLLRGELAVCYCTFGPGWF